MASKIEKMAGNYQSLAIICSAGRGGGLKCILAMNLSPDKKKILFHSFSKIKYYLILVFFSMVFLIISYLIIHLHLGF